MIKRVISYFIFKIKGRVFQFDSNVSNTDLVDLVLSHFFSFLRGYIRLGKLVSLGSRASLSSKRNIHLGKGVSIGKDVTLDGLGVTGLIIGSGSSIGAFSILKVSGSLANLGDVISLGNNVGIGDFSHIGGAGGVYIGHDTIVGSFFSVHPQNHNFSNKKELIRLQGVTQRGIKVGNNCWIGAKVTLLDGCEVGNGCIIAAGAVVNGIFPDNVVIGGVPARILKER